MNDYTLSATEVMQITNIRSRNTLHTWREKGLKSWRRPSDGHVFFKPADIEKLQDARRNGRSIAEALAS